MNRIATHLLSPLVVIALGTAVLAGCTEETPLTPAGEPAVAAASGRRPDMRMERAIATLRRATARYRDLNVALADGFVLLHPCEVRPGEGPVGTVYVHMGRLTDGRIDAEKPDALIYEPGRNNRQTLVGVEFALPYPMWDRDRPPTFLGVPFQREDEFGVWALHAWVWRHNPDGMFAEANPRVNCGTD